jgi:hypothetical protein
MPSVISAAAREGSTYVITCAFKDETGTAVSPTTMSWSLTDTDGVVINSRTDVAISSPSASENIVLGGSDLPIIDGDRILILTLEGTYTSANGAGLALKEQVRFTVKDLTAV